jgi:hypothetical protein
MRFALTSVVLFVALASAQVYAPAPYALAGPPTVASETADYAAAQKDISHAEVAELHGLDEQFLASQHALALAHADPFIKHQQLEAYNAAKHQLIKANHAAKKANHLQFDSAIHDLSSWKAALLHPAPLAALAPQPYYPAAAPY